MPKTELDANTPFSSTTRIWEGLDMERIIKQRYLVKPAISAVAMRACSEPLMQDGIKVGVCSFRPDSNTIYQAFETIKKYDDPHKKIGGCKKLLEDGLVTVGEPVRLVSDDKLKLFSSKCYHLPAELYKTPHRLVKI